MFDPLAAISFANTGSWAWVYLTLMAVVMQTLRTAGQKQLTSDLSPIGTTLVRFLFGLPWVILILALVLRGSDRGIPALHGEFLFLAIVASILQIVATALLVHLFSLRNFAVGTTYARTEAFLTALIGALFFGELISFLGWVAIVFSVTGVLILTVARSEHVDSSVITRLTTPEAGYGLATGLCFALGSLVLRKASLSLGLENWLLSASITLVTMVTIQTVILLAWVSWKEREQFPAIRRRLGLSAFVGLTSALGSIGWFTAMTLERASYVKALGQIEFLTALVVSGLFFRERSNLAELLAMALIAGGVLILVLWA